MMTDAERVWMMVAGRAPVPADAMSVASVEAIITQSRRRLPNSGLDLFNQLLVALGEVAATFGIAVPGADDCECMGECPCHVLTEEADR